ncbi:MAG TPA: YqaJ viral recombinase family protein [Terriglobales bacterium]|nr:YqaJ viral recombinase family protein [Terriglobales bacterium]
MKIIGCIQGTPEWHAARAGRVTASRIADMMARTKSGYGAGRANYLAELVAERLTGTVAEGFTNAAMRHGTETEPEARAAYQFFRDAEVQEVGFVVHPTIEMSGCSPDGIIDGLGLVEIKCPNSATHIDTLLGAGIPDKYLKQMQWQMACTGATFCDFVSYDPRLPTRMQLFVERIERNDAMIAEIEREALVFLQEVDAKVLALTAKYGDRAAA